MTDGLIAFAFEGKPQDTERFCNEPYWRERFGSAATGKRRFGWTNFYEAIAEKLLACKDNRQALVKGIQKISLRVEGLGHLAQDQYAGGGTGFVKDICPFTTMGLFNRGIKDSNRKVIAAELAELLGVEEAVPETFEGIPVLNNLKSWYFPLETSREADHIDRLWTVFAAAIRFADSDDAEARPQFAKAFDHVNDLPNVAWNLTFGLYWIRPWSFLSLDQSSRGYLTHKLGLPLGLNGPKRGCNAADYCAAMDTLEPRFQESSYPVHSYPELSIEARLYSPPASGDSPPAPDDDDPTAAPIVPYAVDDILRDGCFLEKVELEGVLDRLRSKKNIILQGTTRDR